MKDPNYYADLYNSYEKNPKKIRVLDSTLREGEQHPGVSFTNKQRIQIAWMLDYFGVDQIEISPVVSDDHKEAVKTIIKQGLNADIVSHGRALKEDIDVSLSCDAKWCAAYLGISDIHLKDKLRITRQQAMERAVETVEYAKSHGLKIRFTVEDGSRAEPEFLLKMCRAIEEAGVDRISLPDTVGILRPVGMYNFVKKVRSAVDTPLDAHVHNDIGFALANAFAACDGGVDQIHTTIDGIGERTGIPSLAEVSVALTYLYKSPNDFRLDMLQDLSRLIEEYTIIKPYDSKPIVGSSAYKHKAGTHLAAILRNPAAYEPIPPRTVGNRRRIVFGELAGKTGASYLMSILGLEKDSESAKAVATGLKNLRMGDLIEIPLADRLEKKIINDDKKEKPEEK
ncbi:MAG: 2-isopropylmalate synthase [Nitrosopumilaceae archaeon]|jgi:2-isopropylmalate synthase|uniref:2-isopropylmalate synthase n=3 Tax=Candidatus Nitrosomaritimum aestuariumsis TaxID=3342354 RepID=A0AC60VZP3_9ARCH|nr:2-isopropylmalate synthase [Nitrosopumilaceae archaeon]MBA4453638.1 2-isopropylmalate synthase [Nitrosopumilaceae archaeon]MBA4460914.1 2-isopropylmalate synthase [Nitrosopumilaceae archaeon]MBA4464179.1 2-isopropylmalate synthase [Nitrosopumilaceae archaeon]NCF22376.1 2-isopropylmalate synthase [Nitrosopumilaceae archaeon]